MEFMMRYERKNRGEFWRYGKEKFIHIEPCITAMRSTGRPADLNVKRSIMITNSAESMLIRRLSFANELERSRSDVEFPTQNIWSAG